LPGSEIVLVEPKSGKTPHVRDGVVSVAGLKRGVDNGLFEFVKTEVVVDTGGPDESAVYTSYKPTEQFRKFASQVQEYIDGNGVLDPSDRRAIGKSFGDISGAIKRRWEWACKGGEMRGPCPRHSMAMRESGMAGGSTVIEVVVYWHF
jgi:hypothetical protein